MICVSRRPACPVPKLTSLASGRGSLCTAGALLWQLGSALYLAGYKDTSKDVKTARYQKGGGIKWLGITIGIGASISFAGTLLKWW